MTRPNILLIMTDDMRHESVFEMSAHQGNSVGSILVKSGVSFLNSFTTSAQCSPSRASMLTGQYAHNHGLYSNLSIPPHDYASMDEASFLPVAIQNAGYRTGLFGKYINGYGDTHIPPGWNRWFGMLGGTGDYNYTVSDQGAARAFGTAPEDHASTVIANETCNWIAHRAGKPEPFFAYVGFTEPHALVTPDARFSGVGPAMGAPRVPGWNGLKDPEKPAHVRNLPLFSSYPIDKQAQVDEQYRAYRQRLFAIDCAIGRIITALGTAINNTIIIFTADHGIMSGQHRIPLSKVVPYDPSVRVPLVIRGPGVDQQRTRTELVSNVDVAATIADLSGAVPLRPLDGKSLVPLFSGTRNVDPVAFREYLLLEFMEDYPMASIHGMPNHMIPAYSGVRSHKWKYVKYATAETELYDMVSDPFELSSLQNDPAFATVAADLELARAELAESLGPV